VRRGLVSRKGARPVERAHRLRSGAAPSARLLQTASHHESQGHSPP
jgi:hypothetical protein